MDDKEIRKNNKWEAISKILRIIEVTTIVGGVVFAIVQLKDVRNMQSAQLMLDLNSDLSNATNSKVITAIEDGKYIF